MFYSVLFVCIVCWLGVLGVSLVSGMLVLVI